MNPTTAPHDSAPANALPAAGDAPLDKAPTLLWDLLFFVAAILMAAIFRPPYFTDWDSFDYAVAAVNGTPSDLALGRMFFIGMHALAWQIAHNGFGLSPFCTYDLFCNLTIFVGGLAAVAIFRATFHLTRSLYAAVLMGVIWITSPLPVVYAGSIMTETPTMLMFALAIFLTEKAIRRTPDPPGKAAAALIGLAGACFAVACNMREPLVLFGLYFAGRCLLGPRKWRDRITASAMFVAGFAVFMFIGITLAAWRLGGYDKLLEAFNAWRGQMSQERLDYPNVVPNNVQMLLLFSGAVTIMGLFWSPVAAVYFVRRWIAGRRASGLGCHPTNLTPLGWLFIGSGLYLVSLLFNHDTPVNPRFAIPLMFPVLIAEAVMLAEIVARRDLRWLIALLICGTLGNLMVAVGVTWQVMWFLPPAQARIPSTCWMLLAIFTALAGVLVRQIVVDSPRPRAVLWAAGLATVLGLFILLGGRPLADYHFFQYSRYHKQFVTAMTDPHGGVPDDAMLIPSGETPALQYVTGVGQHQGWKIWALPYKEDLLAEVGQPKGKGWFVVSSGWNWPNGKNYRNVENAPDSKARLVDLVDRYLAGGGRVFVYGGDSAWVPPERAADRNTEWPELKQLQETHVISENEVAPNSDMFEVFKDRPAPGNTYYPIGHRKAIRDGRYQPKPLDDCRVPTTQPTSRSSP